MKKIIFMLFLVIVSNLFSLTASSTTLKSFERSTPEPAGSVKPVSFTSYETGLKKDNRYNGDDWNSINRLIQHGEVYAGIMIKLALVRGIYEGARTMDAIKTKMSYYADIPYKGIVEALDVFYTEERNLGIPVAEALKIVSMIFKGENKTIIEDAVKTLQASFAF